MSTAERLETVKENTTVQRLKTQKELFAELAALVRVQEFAEKNVEAKMLEMAQELGSTFRHEGLCEQHPEANVLQIRVRFNKAKNRKVPFFVPLPDMPDTWLGKAARDTKKGDSVETDGSQTSEDILA